MTYSKKFTVHPAVISEENIFTIAIFISNNYKSKNYCTPFSNDFREILYCTLNSNVITKDMSSIRPFFLMLPQGGPNPPNKFPYHSRIEQNHGFA